MLRNEPGSVMQDECNKCVRVGVLGAWPGRTVPQSASFKLKLSEGNHPGWVKPLPGVHLTCCGCTSSAASIKRQQGYSRCTLCAVLSCAMKVALGQCTATCKDKQEESQKHGSRCSRGGSCTFPCHFGVRNHSLGRCVQLCVFCFGRALGLFLLFLGGEMGCNLGG